MDTFAEYNSWDKAQLQTWLRDHGIEPPKGYSQKELQALVKSNWDQSKVWSQAQYDRAQQVFANVREDVFDTWDESRLREFLVEQGVVAPSGPREKLVLAAKQQCVPLTDSLELKLTLSSGTMPMRPPRLP